MIFFFYHFCLKSSLLTFSFIFLLNKIVILVFLYYHRFIDIEFVNSLL